MINYKKGKVPLDWVYKSSNTEINVEMYMHMHVHEYKILMQPHVSDLLVLGELTQFVVRFGNFNEFVQ